MVSKGKSKGTDEMPQTGCEGCQGTSGFLMMLLGILTLFILFDQETRTAIGRGIGVILFPIIGFDFNGDGSGDYPLLTIAVASIITGIWSTVIRHVTTDWIRQAEIQNYLNSYNKELQKAMRERNQGRVKQLNKLQPELMQMQNEMMTSQMKQMVLTMFFAIMIFTWIWQGYIPSLREPYVSVPWAETVKLTANPYLFPNWILLYSMFSIVFSQVLMRGLKVVGFKKALEKETIEEMKRGKAIIERLEFKLEQMRREGMVVDKFRRRLEREWKLLDENQGLSVEVMSGEIEKDMEREYKIFQDAYKQMKSCRKNLKIAKKMGYLTAKCRELYNDAKKAFEGGNYRNAKRLFEGFKAELAIAREDYEEAKVDLMDLEDKINSVKAEGIDTSPIEEILASARVKIYNGDYSGAKADIKRASGMLGNVTKKYTNIKRAFETLKERYEEAIKLGLKLEESMEKEYTDIKRAFELRNIMGLMTRIEGVTRHINTIIEMYKKAQDEISFAKLVIKNAGEYGIDISRYEQMLSEAEDLMIQGKYQRAVEIATEARNRAESEKKRVKRQAKRK